MKQLAAILIVLSFAWNLLAEAAVYISFKINQDYIAEFLCINRDDPESDCHGCCQLKKELQEQQESRSEMPQSENKKTEIQYFQQEDHQETPLFQIVRQRTSIQYSTYSFKFWKAVFRPPQYAS